MLGEIWVNVASGLAGGFIVWLLQRCWNLGKLLPLALKCNNRNKRIRVSVSYLIRVKVGEKFLLVKGEKINQWQPVGGVYKTFKDTESALSDLSVKYDDESTPHRPGCERDLRINLPRRNIIKFIRWFESGKEREVGPWREFYEELIETNILPQKEFHFIFARFIRRHRTPIHYSPHFNQDEILIADIYELVPTEGQYAELNRLSSIKDSQQFILLKLESLKRYGFDKETRTSLDIPLSETVGWTIQDLI